MEYLIAADGPFHQIEDQTTEALRSQGFIVQRTFSLVSATAGANGDQLPGFSVLMLYGEDAQEQSLGLLTLYEQTGGVVLRATLRSPAQDTEADLVVALTLAGLDFCVHAAGGLDCIDPKGLQPSADAPTRKHQNSQNLAGE